MLVAPLSRVSFCLARLAKTSRPLVQRVSLSLTPQRFMQAVLCALAAVFVYGSVARLAARAAVNLPMLAVVSSASNKADVLAPGSLVTAYGAGVASVSPPPDPDHSGLDLPVKQGPTLLHSRLLQFA